MGIKFRILSKIMVNTGNKIPAGSCRITALLSCYKNCNAVITVGCFRFWKLLLKCGIFDDLGLVSYGRMLVSLLSQLMESHSFSISLYKYLKSCGHMSNPLFRYNCLLSSIIFSFTSTFIS